MCIRDSHHGADHLVHAGVGLGVQDDGAADVKAGLFGGGVDGIRVAHQHGGQPGTGQQPGAGLQDAGIGALGEDDLLGIFLQNVDEGLEHMHGHGKRLHKIKLGRLTGRTSLKNIIHNPTPLLKV